MGPEKGRGGGLEDRQTDSPPTPPSSLPPAPSAGHSDGLTPAKRGPLPMFFHPARNKAQSCQTRGDSYTSRLFLPLKE